MKGHCPICEKDTRIEKRAERRRIKCRGVTVRVKSEFFACRKGHDFETFEQAEDFYHRVYTAYRRAMGMLQPDEMRRLRLLLGESIFSFAPMVGLTARSLARIEDGSLHDAHTEKEYRRLMRLVEKGREG